MTGTAVSLHRTGGSTHPGIPSNSHFKIVALNSDCRTAPVYFTYDARLVDEMIGQAILHDIIRVTFTEFCVAYRNSISLKAIVFVLVP